MNENTKIRRGSLFFAVCAALLALFCVFAGACSAKDDDGNKNFPEQTIVAPNITGPAGQTVLEGYSSFSSERFIVSGDNVSVSANVPVAAADKIVWNAESLCLSVSGGLSAGKYEVTLTATNGNAAMDKTLVYTLTVEKCDPPKITVENDCLYLIEDYGAITSDEFTVSGTSVKITATCGNKNADGKIVWNDTTKRLEIAAGLPVDGYTVVLTASNGTPAMNAVLEYKIFVTPIPQVLGEEEIVLLGADYQTSVFAYSSKGRNVTVEKRSGNDLIVWNAEEQTLTVGAGLEVGEHKVELVAANGDEVHDSVFEISVIVKRLYNVTGSYEYGSGRYDAASGKYINAGDGNVTAKVGEKSVTVNEQNQTYTLERVPEGEYVVAVESDYYFPAEIKIVVSGENEAFSIQEKVVLKNTKMSDNEGITYGENGEITVAGNTAALFAGSPATAAGEGFAVKYTVLTNGSTGWFNRGGLHVETNATDRQNHDFGFVSTGAKWAIYVKQSDVNERDNLSIGFAAFNKQDEWNVTAVYSDGVYYLSYESLDGAKTYTTALVAQSFTYAKGSEIVDTTLTRALGLSCYVDSTHTTTFKNISYAIGNEAAKAELNKMPNPEYNVTVTKGTRFALPEAEAKNGEGFVINYTVNDNGCTGFLRRGGLYIVSTENGVERRYRFGTYQSGLYVGSSDEATENRDYYYKNLAIQDGKWEVTIVFYDGVYYTKFTQGDTVYTKKIDASTQSDTSDSLNDTNKAVIYSKTATRKLWLHSFTQENKYDTKLNKVTYSIGNEAAQAAIAAMGFEN